MMKTIATQSAHGTTRIDLAPHAPKPTSLTEGQTEASKSVWSEGTVETGLWECTPGAFTAERRGYTEICTILAGSVTITAEGSEAEDFGPGDIVVMPSGWKGEWNVHETLRKHFTIVVDA